MENINPYPQAPSDDLFKLLLDYEASGYIKKENGNIVGIQIYDAGDGGLTFPIGVFVADDDTNRKKIIKEQFGINVTRSLAGTWIDYETAYDIYVYFSESYIDKVNYFLIKNDIVATQQQFLLMNMGVL